MCGQRVTVKTAGREWGRRTTTGQVRLCSVVCKKGSPSLCSVVNSPSPTDLGYDCHSFVCSFTTSGNLDFGLISSFEK